MVTSLTGHRALCQPLELAMHEGDELFERTLVAVAQASRRVVTCDWPGVSDGIPVDWPTIVRVAPVGVNASTRHIPAV